MLSAVVTPSLCLQNPAQELSRECVGDMDTNRLAPSMASRLWLHLQQTTPCKSSAVLQSFVSTDSSYSLRSQINGPLEESGQERQVYRRSRLLVVGPPRGETSDCHHILKDDPATTMTYYGIPSQQRGPRSTTSSDHKSKEVDDELLLGDECFVEPLNVVTYLRNTISNSQALLAAVPSHACGTNRRHSQHAPHPTDQTSALGRSWP